LADNTTRGTGRRKTAIARVRLTPGEGRVMINEKTPLAYLGRRILEMEVLEPLKLTDSLRRFDVSVKVEGGGVSGQAGAIAHGIASPWSNMTPTAARRSRRPASSRATRARRSARSTA